MSQNRQHARFDFVADVEVETETGTHPGTTVNISQGGALLQTAAPCGFGEKLTLHIDLPGVKDTCQIPCIVRWSKEGDSLGVQFETLRAIEVWAINRLKRV
ncbi:MAG: PilZ domain-containing protein [Proteobacteria bacterium]|nr:PilZ domain-containing protein [Pseudomonadota bacterium]